MINPLEFEGGYQLGPKSFAEQTGRDKIWRLEPQQVVLQQERNCPLCGADKPEFLFEKCDGVNHWDYSRCSGCGMVYTHKAPKAEVLDEIYKTAPAMQEWVRLQQNPIEVEMDTKKFQWALEQAGWGQPGRWGGRPRLLDIGCSTGTLMVVAGRMAPQAVLHGVEINTEALRVAGDRLRHEKGVGAQLLYNDIKNYNANRGPGDVDLVVLWEVLEHLLDPAAMLKDAVSLMHPGGRVLICVPNIKSLAACILHEKAPMFGLGHVNMFSPETLSKLVLRCGLKPVHITSIISWYKEIQNWLNLRPPMHADKPASKVMTDTPEEILKSLQGYKLVMIAEKEKL